MKKRNLLLSGFTAFALSALANPVVVKMNAVSTTMTLADKETGMEIALPEPVNREYTLDLTPGEYVITGIASDGQTVNGTIVMNVTDSVTTQIRAIITCTAYVSNKTDGVSWNMENGDYDLSVKVNTREGEAQTITTGHHTAAGRYTFLAFNGNSYNVAFIPSEAHQADGYMTLYRGGTLTANVNVTGAIPLGGDFSITVPDDATLELGMKFTHFTDFQTVEPDNVEAAEGGLKYNFTLANGQVYNYRTWKEGGLTHGGYFTMNLDDAKRPQIGFTDADYAKHDPKQINHTPQSNNGYETGDLFLNINERGHLRLPENGEFLVHAMRTWELSDNSTNNYFFEPDFHYTVLDTDFNPSNAVIEIENADTRASAWSKIKAKGAGTAIVMVTYDGINLNYYNNSDKKDYLGGEYWGAIWPENTGVFIVTVGDGESTANPNMVVNEQYNVGALRLAGKYMDAEHDVFYYLEDEQDGFPFTFTPEGITAVTMASPEISETDASYNGFSDEGVTLNEDGSYTLLLKKGRNIVKMTDAAGNTLFQVVRAKPCHREITNLTRPGSEIFQPGDQVKIQYSGLFHPANKIAGIYNMSAYVTYNGTPNGSSLILGSGQYTFGSAPSAQAVTVEIPEDYNAEENPLWVMNEGVIQVNGYGDPIGNHRNTSPLAGRSPNFTAVPHKTYFGAIPDISLPITPMKLFDITLASNVEDADVTLTFGDKTLEPGEDGTYTGTFGTYNVVAKKAGYRCFRASYVIEEDAETARTFAITMVEGVEGMWDGESATEVLPDDDGIYHITTGSDLAYLAQAVAENGKNLTATIVLDNDIDLGDFDWSPIGTSSSKAFSGKFNGNGHKISGLYINKPATGTMALFGYVTGNADAPAEIRNLTVEGYVCGKQYVGGIVANLNANALIDECANLAEIEGTSYAGGIVGYISSSNNASVTNCYNHGDVTATTNVGGIAGYNNAAAIIDRVYSVGTITGNEANTGACVGSTTMKTNVTNAYAIAEYGITDGHILVTEAQMASGEVAFLLGVPFTQEIGKDLCPVFNSAEVLYDENTGKYFNESVSTGITDADGFEGDPTVDVYDLTGSLLLHGTPVSRLADLLSPGLYILTDGTISRKLLLR